MFIRAIRVIRGLNFGSRVWKIGLRSPFDLDRSLPRGPQVSAGFSDLGLVELAPPTAPEAFFAMPREWWFSTGWQVRAAICHLPPITDH